MEVKDAEEELREIDGILDDLEVPAVGPYPGFRVLSRAERIKSLVPEEVTIVDTNHLMAVYVGEEKRFEGPHLTGFELFSLLDALNGSYIHLIQQEDAFPLTAKGLP